MYAEPRFQGHHLTILETTDGCQILRIQDETRFRDMSTTTLKLPHLVEGSDLVDYAIQACVWSGGVGVVTELIVDSHQFSLNWSFFITYRMASPSSTSEPAQCTCLKQNLRPRTCNIRMKACAA